MYGKTGNAIKEKCKTDIKLKWPILFKRFIDDGFGIMEGNKLDFEHGSQNLICYEKPSRLINFILEMRKTSWIYLYTKVKNSLCQRS